MYNILHAMHSFPLELRNIDVKNKPIGGNNKKKDH